MQYTEPKVINTVNADSAIQSLAKIGDSFDSQEQPTPSVGYRADE